VQAAGRQWAYHVDQARITLLQDALRALVPNELALPLCALFLLSRVHRTRILAKLKQYGSAANLLLRGTSG